MLGPNTIYDEIFRFFNDPEEKLFKKMCLTGQKFSKNLRHFRFDSNFAGIFINPNLLKYRPMIIYWKSMIQIFCFPSQDDDDVWCNFK